MIKKINFRHLGYFITIIGVILMIVFAYNEEKKFQFSSLIFTIIGLIITFESSRIRAFKFSKNDWIQNDDNDVFFIVIRKVRHLKNMPTPSVYVMNNGSLELGGFGIQIEEDKTVKIYSNVKIKNKTIVKI